MPWIDGTIDATKVAALFGEDREFLHRLKGLDGLLRIAVTPDFTLDLTVRGGRIESDSPSDAIPALTLTVPRETMEKAARQVPPPGYEALMTAAGAGVVIGGPDATVVAAYAGLLSRAYDLLRRAGGVVVDVPVPEGIEEGAADDAIVGRYVRITVDGIQYRVFYEEAGTGDQALLLQHTAGADARQWRHQLGCPEFQRRYRMIAYDLPYHGRSLPPPGVAWWAQDYKPTKQWLMAVVVAIADALGLERPIFMGCSVGGQLALDLSAHFGARFAATVALNGTLDNPAAGDPRMDSWNDLCRDNRFTNDFYAIGNFNATSPLAPEAYRRELYWIYRSNFQGVYAGDNDYFLTGHDLKVDGHLIDADRTPTIVIACEYDPVAGDAEHGGPAVERLVSGVRYRRIEGLGHFAPTDDPARFRTAILPILEEIDASIRTAEALSLQSA